MTNIATAQESEVIEAISLSEAVLLRRQESRERMRTKLANVPGGYTWREYLINRSFLGGVAWFVPILLRMLGVKVGHGVKCLGRLRIKIRGKASNIEIGDNVLLGDGVDLRNRENGRIIIRDGVALDHNVRIVAAREATVEIGAGCRIGINTVINAGGDVRLGEFTLVASLVNINTSNHGTDIDSYIQDQPHVHGAIHIGSDCWIASGSSVLSNTTVHEGAVIGANAICRGEVPPFAIYVSSASPRIVRHRQ